MYRPPRVSSTEGEFFLQLIRWLTQLDSTVRLMPHSTSPGVAGFVDTVYWSERGRTTRCSTEGRQTPGSLWNGHGCQDWRDLGILILTFPQFGCRSPWLGKVRHVVIVQPSCSAACAVTVHSFLFYYESIKRELRALNISLKQDGLLIMNR